MTDKRFEISVYPPMHKIEGKRRVNPENKELTEYHRSKGDVTRILDKRQLKEYERRLRDIKRFLTRTGIKDVILARSALKIRINDLRADRYRIVRRVRGVSDKRVLKAEKVKFIQLKKQIHLLLEELKQLNDELEPHQDTITEMLELQRHVKDHYNALEDDVINRKNRDLLSKEANYIADVIISTYNRMGLCHRVSVRRGRQVIEKVTSIKFQEIVVTADSIQAKLLVYSTGIFGGGRPHLPHGKKARDFVEPDVLDTLSAAVGMKVTCPTVPYGDDEEKKPHRGYWLRIARNEDEDGLPKFVSYSKFMARYEKKSGQLTIPGGLREGNWTDFYDMSRFPHYLVTGQTGSGKTRLIKAIIATLIANYSPQEIQFAFIDLKEGIDYYQFHEVPHCLTNVIEDIQGAAEVLLNLEQIRRERSIELKKAGCVDVDQFNRRYPEYKIPHIMVVFDEYGALSFRSHGDKAPLIYSICEQLVMKGRSAAIHLLVGAQTPRVNHVPAPIKDNVSLQFHSRQGTIGGSISSIGSRKAKDIPDVSGRFLRVIGAKAVPVQFPFISDDEINDAIDRAMQYEPVETNTVFLPGGDASPVVVTIEAASINPLLSMDDFIKICLEQLDGGINYRQVYEIAKDMDVQASVGHCKKLADELKQNSMIEFHGVAYELVTNGPGKRLQVYNGEYVSHVPDIFSENVSEYHEVENQ